MRWDYGDSPSAKANIKVAGKVLPTCGDKAHSQLKLHTTDGSVIETKSLNFNREVHPKGADAILHNLSDFVLGGLDPRVLGQSYVIELDSCGAPASGPATSDLNALVTVLPAGMLGFKLGFGPLKTKLAFSAGQAKNDHDDEEASAKALASEKARLEKRVAKEEARGAQLGKKRPSGGKERKALQAKIRGNNSSTNKYKNQLEKINEQIDDSEDSVEIGVIIFDRVSDTTKIKKIKSDIIKIKNKIDSAEKIINQIQDVLTFAKKYSPSVVAPTASIEMSVGMVDMFVGVKLTSNGKLEGPRYRALARFFDVDVTLMIADVKGGLGITVGKHLWGTGATIEAMVTVSIGISGNCEFKTSIGPSGQTDNWKEKVDVKIMPEMTAGGSLIGTVNLFSFHIAQVGGAINGAARFRASATLADILEKKVSVVAICDPLIGTVDAEAIGGYWTKRYSYTIWEGGTWPLA